MKIHHVDPVFAWHVWAFARLGVSQPGDFTSATLPGHERDLGPTMRSFEWEMRKMFERVREPPSERSRELLLGGVVEQARRNGMPAVRAYFDDEVIVVEMAEPKGFG